LSKKHPFWPLCFARDSTSPFFRAKLGSNRGWGSSISRTQDIDAGGLIPAASLLFATGERPDAQAIAELAESSSGFAVSHDPGETSGDCAWLELLVSGLTFDLKGLAPGPGTDPPKRRHEFGLPADFYEGRLEAVTLQPGPHLVEGATMLPVVHSLAGLAAQLCALASVRAVAWHPASSWCAPQHFRDSVNRWLEGGVFPGLALAALAAMADGGMQSQGLALFTGQEFRLEPDVADDPASTAKLGLRLMHWLVEHGPVAGPETLPGPEDQRFQLDPSADGRIVRVWRG
jgi:hypothetical protein